MAIGERIRFFRNLRGMTQKYLGQVVGFPEKTADIRMAQYESGSRTPKAELTESLAGALGVSPLALSVPDIDSYLGLMHTLFTLEDRYGLTVETGENGVFLRVDPRKGKDAAELSEMLTAWAEQAERLRNGEINREDYDKWRYNYPKYDEASGYVKVPSQQLSDALMFTVVLVLPAFMLLTVVGTNSISRPLTEMANVAIEMSKGNFEVRADETSSGETGILARALNTLCDNLSQTIYQLQNEKRQLNQLLTSFTDGVAAIDRLGCLTHYNPALMDMFGAVDVHTPMDLVPDEKVWHEFDSVLETQKSKTLSYSLPGNRALWISIVPVLAENGECIGAVGLFKDVTEFERLEQTRRDYVANVSHELRTPLTAVRGLLEPLSDGMVKDAETQKRYYDIMMHEVLRMSRLITDLLQLSRLQSGSEYMEVSAVNLQELLEEMQQNYKVEAAQHGIRLELKAENVPYAMTDRDRVEQILVILIDNAMRYTPEGGSITLSAEAGERIVVSVTDTGCGIAAEELPHLFERFYKVDKSRKEGGTGLGLSIAKQIIDNLGEQITVQSVVGKGTSFHFTLKRYVSNAIALGPSSPGVVYSEDVGLQNQNDVLTGQQDAPYEIIEPKAEKIEKHQKKEKKKRK